MKILDLSQAVKNENYVYVLEYDSECVKIGTSGRVEDRIREVTASTPYPLGECVIVRGSYELETILHQHFSTHRIKGEFFQTSMSVVKEYLSRLDYDMIVPPTKSMEKDTAEFTAWVLIHDKGFEYKSRTFEYNDVTEDIRRRTKIELKEYVSQGKDMICDYDDWLAELLSFDTLSDQQIFEIVCDLFCDVVGMIEDHGNNIEDCLVEEQVLLINHFSNIQTKYRNPIGDVVLKKMGMDVTSEQLCKKFGRNL